LREGADGSQSSSTAHGLGSGGFNANRAGNFRDRRFPGLIRIGGRKDCSRQASSRLANALPVFNSPGTYGFQANMRRYSPAFAFEFGLEPGLGKVPFPSHGFLGDPHDVRGFFDAEAYKPPQLHHPRCAPIDFLELP
jgi:hypothetical protein